MCTENEKDHHWETTIVRGIVTSRVRVYHDLNDTSITHRVDVIPLDMDGIRVATLETYASEGVSIDSLELGDTVFAVVASEPSIEFNDKGSRTSTVYSAVKVLVEEYEDTSYHVNVIRKRTDSWYAKYMGEGVTEHDTGISFMLSGIDFLGIEDTSDSASVSGSSSEKACGCGDKSGLCGPPL